MPEDIIRFADFPEYDHCCVTCEKEITDEKDIAVICLGFGFECEKCSQEYWGF